MTNYEWLKNSDKYHEFVEDLDKLNHMKLIEKYDLPAYNNICDRTTRIMEWLDQEHTDKKKMIYVVQRNMNACKNDISDENEIMLLGYQIFRRPYQKGWDDVLIGNVVFETLIDAIDRIQKLLEKDKVKDEKQL